MLFLILSSTTKSTISFLEINTRKWNCKSKVDAKLKIVKGLEGFDFHSLKLKKVSTGSIRPSKIKLF